MEVGGRLSDATFCNLPLLCAPYPLYSTAPTPLHSISPWHPTLSPLPGTKEVIGPDKAELTGILNDDTL